MSNRHLEFVFNSTFTSRPGIRRLISRGTRKGPHARRTVAYEGVFGFDACTMQQRRYALEASGKQARDLADELGLRISASFGKGQAGEVSLDVSGVPGRDFLGLFLNGSSRSWPW